MDVGTASSLLDRVSRELDVLRRGRLLNARRTAPEFNPLDFMVRDENSLSRIIGWLLAPGGSHAQGDMFLQQFLLWLGGDWRNLSGADATVYLEAATMEGRRMDIHIVEKDWQFVVENKPWAKDQDSQVRDYLRHLDGCSRAGLLYLSGGDRQRPSERSLSLDERLAYEAKGSLICRSYPQLREWVEKCRGACQAPTVWIVLSGLESYIQKEFEGMANSEEQSAITSVITRSESDLEAAIWIAEAWPEIRRSYLDKLRQQIGGLIPDGWTIEEGFSEAAYSGCAIKMPGLGYAFSVEFDGAKCTQFVYGVYRMAGTGQLARQIADALRPLFGEGARPPTEEWPWYRKAANDDRLIRVAHNWRSDPKPWLQIQNGELAKMIADAAHRILSEVSNVCSASQSS